MIPNSIRWRLPLTYAAIALLATLSLGLVLITTLQRYYQQRELDYLNSNATEFSIVAGQLLASGISTETLQSQLKGFSFLAQARVRLVDTSDRVLTDSGVPDRTDVAFGTAFSAPLAGGAVELAPDNAQPDVITFMSIGRAPPADGGMISYTRFITSQVTIPSSATVSTASASRLSVVGTPLGFNVSAEAPAINARSDQVVRQPIQGAAGEMLGYLELSEGPAYGREIVESVARGWAIAGGVAVVLAAAAGWVISRGISAPLLTLTTVTSRMAEGELATRADIRHRDEFGALARSFNEMADRVEETVSALRRFVADAAHELHTPLTALRTDLELVADTDDPAARLGLIERAQAQVTRLAALTSGLLDLSRLEASATRPERQPIDLVGLVHELSEVYASRAEQAGLAFSLDVPGETIAVQGNDEQLRRALSNLLDNAIKFTPGGGLVRVALRRVDNGIELRVEDTGIGIPGDDLPQLFGRFHRGRNAAAYPGSGLGLAIVKAIVENHGGDVTMKNLTPGARFTIRLPTG